MSETLLEVRGLARAFGGVRAVDGVDLEVARGEMVALIGPNGAGKTTTFNLIDGQLAADAGSVRFEGREILGLSPSGIARRGVGRTFQVASTFASMTAEENVEVALRALAPRHAPANDRTARARHAPANDRGTARALLAPANDRGTARALLAPANDHGTARALLARVGAGALANVHAATLAHGDAKLVELAIALAGAPSLLLLDEPAAGIGAGDRAPLMDAVRTMAREGMGALFTEHDMDVVFAYADRVIVLDHGRVITIGTPAAVRADAAVRRAYLGDG